MISLRLPLVAAVVTVASITTIGGAAFGCNRSGAQLRDDAAGQKAL